MPTAAAHSPFTSSTSASSVSQTFSPPTTGYVTFGNSPVAAGGLAPPPPAPMAVPAGGFPPSLASPASAISPSTAGSFHSSYGGAAQPASAQTVAPPQQPEIKRGPAVPPNPELERLLASMRAYNSTYGARLPVLGSPAANASTYEASVTVMADRPFAPASAPTHTITKSPSSTATSASGSSAAAAAIALHADGGRPAAFMREQRPSSEDASDEMVDSDDDEDDDHRPMRAVSVDRQSAATAGRSSSGRRGRNSASSSSSSSSKAAAKRVAGGGLMSSVVVEAEDERGEGEEWRPTYVSPSPCWSLPFRASDRPDQCPPSLLLAPTTRPEEYAKLDSKQKRQLRNKISAKNFRNRRKDYVDRLEGHLSERDRLLAFAREEMRRKERENDELR
jgi:hypothetical protein